MGGLIMKPKHDGSGAYTANPTGADALGVGQVVEGILNLEHRQVNNEAFAKISGLHALTRQVLSLSLANNRITALVFDETSKGKSDETSSGSVAASMKQHPHAHAQNPPLAELLASQPAIFDDEDETEGILRSTSSNHRPPQLQAAPLRSSTNWPILENLDLSGNNELFNYVGLSTVNATLRSLRLANNGIFKVPTEVWALANLTKLDLSHNRLLVLPPGISLLTKLNSLKLSHNSMASTATSSCIPEEMRLCSRLRRLDLSHNKLRELPVNFRVDREHAHRRSVIQRMPSLPQGQGSTTNNNTNTPATATATATAAATSSSASSSSPRLPSIRPVEMKEQEKNSTTSATAAGTSGSAGPPSGSPSVSSMNNKPTQGRGSVSMSTASSNSSSGVSLLHHQQQQPPPPIKYFDPNRVSYIQITLLNLSNNQIDSLSPSIGLLRSLNSLNLGYNKLRSLPTEIVLLTELKYLDLRFNSLISLLTEICQLPRLSKLCLQNNKISTLPYEIRRLKKLTHFFLSSNQLVDLPDVISEVRNVRVLKLCNNKLLTIPDSIFRLQKLRLLDLSFNKLTYLSTDVCNMPLIEDLRLWGNKLSEIPSPILYSDVKKIIAYLRATERERCMIATQMRSYVGPPKSHSRMASLKTAGGGATGANGSSSLSQPASRNRAASATRAHSDKHGRFAPLGFYDDDGGESGNVGGGGLHGSSLEVPSAGGGGPTSSRSVGSAPDRHLGLGPRSASATIGRRPGESGPQGTREPKTSADSGSDDPEEDFDNSDDEFTSMFRAVTSRTASFNTTQDSARGGGGGGGGSGTSSRRSTQPSRSPGPVTGNNLSPSPREREERTTIVQPFQSGGFNLGSGMMGPSSPKGSSRVASAQALRPIRDHRDEDDDDEEVRDGDLDDDDHPPRSRRGSVRGSPLAQSSDVLNDLVRRDWKPVASPRSSAAAASSSGPSSSRSVPTDGQPQSQPQPDKDKLMEEWDMQSMAIEKQQSTGKGTGRARIGAL